MKLLRDHRGVTLIELIVVVFIMVVAIALSTNSFITTLRTSKQQSKISEAQMERIVGLELLRYDIEHAGFGLPWVLPSNFTYFEATVLPAKDYNDATANVPRAIISGNDLQSGGSVSFIPGTDYLVIKSTMVRINDEAQKWTYIYKDDETGNITLKTWGGSDDIASTTKVFALAPRSAEGKKVLIKVGNTFYVEYSKVLNVYPDLLRRGEKFIIFAVGPDQSLRMPFNRADYYVSTSNVPSRCAPNTGVLVKSLIVHQNGRYSVEYPLVDCVADFQIIYGLDLDGNGVIGTYTNADGSTVVGVSRGGATENPTVSEVQNILGDAELLRTRLKEVRLYILTHEGQMDRDYTYGSTTVDVGENFGGVSLGHTGGSAFNLKQNIGDDYVFYRWRVYSLVVFPENIYGGGS